MAAPAGGAAAGRGVGTRACAPPPRRAAAAAAPPLAAPPAPWPVQLAARGAARRARVAPRAQQQQQQQQQARAQPGLPAHAAGAPFLHLPAVLQHPAAPWRGYGAAPAKRAPSVVYLPNFLHPDDAATIQREARQLR